MGEVERSSALAQWLLEDYAQRQAKLNRQIRKDKRPPRRRSRRCRPQNKRLCADPDRQITASPQAFVALSSARYPMPLLEYLVTAASVEFVQHL